MSHSSYHVITFEIPEPLIDVVSGVLYENETQGFEEEKISNLICIKAYFGNEKNAANLLKKLSQKIPGGKNWNITSIVLSAQMFVPQPFDPIELAKDVWIIPPPELTPITPLPNPPPQGGRGQLSTSSLRKGYLMIRPGTAFGTGRHESTQLVSELILNLPENISTLLDVGCGSGILSILAHKIKKIPHVVGIEIDELALVNARDNLELNEAKNILLLNHISLATEKFDCIVANIVTPTILHLKSEFERLLKPKGILILSGITKNEYPEIEMGFKNYTVVKKMEKGEWVGVKYLL